MKRRSITRLLALLLVISVFACDLTVFAETATADESGDKTVAEETTGNDTEDEKSDDASEKDKETDANATEYISDRIDKNYTNISSKYTYSKYTGDVIKYNILDIYKSTVDAEKKVVDSLTTETLNYENADKVVDIGMGDTATFIIDVAQAGVYVFAMDQVCYETDSILAVEMTLKVNGEVPFYECNRLVFESKWKEAEEKVYDKYGNEIVASPSKVVEWSKAYIKDASFRYTTPLLLQLEAGKNEISMKVTEGSIKIGDFYLMGETSVPKYETNHVAEGNFFIQMEAEKPTYKNDSSIRPTCEYDPDLTPYNSKKKVLNILDSASFADSGMSLTYEFTVPADGYYYIGMNYRQSDKVDFPVFTNIYVDGQIPNDQLQGYGIYYAKNFKKTTVKDSNGKKMGIYLTEGTHQVTIELANDKIRECLESFDRVMSEVNDLSLEITKVAGTTTSEYRDIEIKEYIPDIEERLQRWIDEIEESYKYLSQFSNAKNCGTISYLVTAIERLEDLAKDPNDIPYRRGELATDTASVNQDIANTINELNANNLSIDSIYIYQEGGKDQIPGKTNIFVKIWESVVRFIASFGAQSYSTGDADPTHLQVWINRPRQYLEIIQQLVDTTFTPQTGIEVDLCIMPDAQKLILANAAGESPDVAQAIDYTQPFELAVRNALVDLTQFEDYKEVMGWFPEGILVPSVAPSDNEYGAGIYSLPETFYFWVLFYRTDILEKLNIEVPETMADVQTIIPQLKNRGLEFFYPTAGTTGQRSFAMTTPLLYQYGTSLYVATDDEASSKAYYATAINSEDGIAGFEALTELFTIYDIPQECSSFFQHFRNGDVPIGIADYFMYSQLINAAPEIENSWEISLVPGIQQTDAEGKPMYDEEGKPITLNMTAGAAQNSCIMKSDSDVLVTNINGGEDYKREDAAWEYLKWWMSTETQVAFGNNLQITYGKEYIWNSANIEAFQKLSWKSRDKAIIVEAMENIVESPRIPGTYMLERELSNAYIDVVINGTTLRTALDSAVKRIDRETKRKLQEFGYLDESGNIVKEYSIPSVETVREIIGTN
ncbi:MAG: extracellular solute-binding protein [Lachnospiraceae bacterium]|nr:extracellular solute-binding protein [Lachnospiraceae bacterium]